MPDNKTNCVLTSPPYNIIRPGLTDRGYDKYCDGINNSDYLKWCCEIFAEFDRILTCDGVVLWNMSYGSENTELLPLFVAEIIRETKFTLADIIVWKKQSAFPNNMSKNKLTRICEFVFVFCRKEEFLTFETNKKQIGKRKTGQATFENIFNFIEAKNNDEVSELNKATFSIEFVKKLLNIYVKPHSVVLDCFMGTGTTAMACIDMNINFIGFEISEKQCEFVNKRIFQRLRQISIFDEINYTSPIVNEVVGEIVDV